MKVLEKTFDELNKVELENRSNFDCGEPTLNTYIKKTMRQHEVKNISRSTLLVAEDSTIVGYYTLTTSEVDFGHIPASISVKNKFPQHKLPVVSLARLAVDTRFQKQGYGELLMSSCIVNAKDIIKRVGGVCLCVHALNEVAADFYRQYGFESSPNDTLHLYMTLK